MAKHPNLIDQSQRTKAEQREIARLGGIASGLSRRKKRDMRSIFQALRDEKITTPMPGGGQEDVSLDVAAALAMYRKAINGNTHAMKLIAEMLGEFETKLAIKAEGPQIVPMTQDAIDALGKWARKDDK